MHYNPQKQQLDLTKTSRRGKFHTERLPENEIRSYCVSVRLNENELSILEEKRGSYKKGEWLRMASLNKLPGNDSNLLIVFYVQIMPDDFVMQLHRF